MNFRRTLNRFISKIEFKLELALFTGFLLGIPLAYLLSLAGLGMEHILVDGAILYSKYVKIYYFKLLLAVFFRRSMELGFLAFMIIRRRKRWEWLISALFGLKIGVYLTLCILRFAFGGFFFAFLSCFPQGIFYIISLFIVFYTCYMVPKNNCPSESIKEALFSNKFLLFIISLAVAIIGMLCECYVNSFLEKIFFHLFC